MTVYWSTPRVIQDSPLDDRDAGILNLGGGRLLVSWFTSNTQQYAQEDWVRDWLGAEELAGWQAVLSTWTDETIRRWLGSWVILSQDRGVSWSAPLRVPLSAPHGPIRLRSGELCYLGKRFVTGWEEMNDGMIMPPPAMTADGVGKSWARYPSTPARIRRIIMSRTCSSPPTGRLLGAIRVEDHSGKELAGTGVPSFSIMLTSSEDGGHTWSPAHPLGFHGSPPHLLSHSSGVLLLTYGYRLQPYGQRVAFSRDDGATWEHDWIIRDDGPDGDLGYPSTVELADGSLLTVCYQKVPGDRKCSLLWSRWRLP